MRGGAFGRCLIRAKSAWRDLIFRAFVVLGLIVVSVGFGLQYEDQKHRGYGTENTEAEGQKPDERIADYTWWLTFFTAILGTVSIVQMGFLYRSDQTARITADAALGSAEIAKKTLIASQRAWLRIDKVEFTGAGISIDRNGVNATVAVQFTNVGQSVAINVATHVELVSFRPGVFPWQAYEALCERARKGVGMLEEFIFPGESYPRPAPDLGLSYGVNINIADLTLAREIIQGQFLQLSIIGCVDYTFPVDPEGHHQTGFMFDVRPKTMPFMIADQEGLIPSENITLMGTFTKKHVD